MNVLRATVVVVAVTSLFGCQFYTRGTTGVPKQSIRHGEPIAIRKDHLPGAGELLPDGRVRYIVALDQLCQAPKLVDEQFVRSPAITGGGIAYFVASGAILAAGAGVLGYGVLGPQELGSDNSTRNIQVGIGVSALIVGVALIGLGAARGRKEKRQVLASSESPVTTRPDGVEDVACKDPVAELGPLELSTPWGTKSSGPVDASGAITFDVVWVGDQLDPDAPTAESLIAAPWKVAATKGKISTTWQPLGPQLPQALDIARAAKKAAKSE